MINILIPTITRPLISFPFDYIVIKKQIEKNKSYSQIFSEFGNESKLMKKFLKFHMIELTLKSSVYSIYYYTKKYATELSISKKYNYFPDLVATTIISSFDIFIINPFERIKICTINNKLIPKFNFNNIKWYLTGGFLTFTTSFIHVGTFLTINNMTKKYYLDKNKQKISIYESFIIGTYTSLIQSALTYPIITLRTRFQNENLINLISLKKFILNKNNYNKLYSGITSRFLRGFLIVIFDTYWINNLKY